MSAPLFSCRDLTVLVEADRGLRRALDRLSLEIRPGEPFGLLGESGSGKTLLLHSVLGLSDAVPGIVAGSAELLGQPLFPEIGREVNWEPGPPEAVRKDVAAWNRRLRRRVAPVLGRDVGLVPQDPGTAFPPYLTVGDLLARAVRRRDPGLTRGEARRLGIEHLARVGMYGPEEVANQFPYQLSGGMAQRLALALALAPRPVLLVADEPTTGLDATLRLRVLQLLARAPTETGTTLLLVTHDTEAARLLCWRVAVLCGGRLVEEGPVGRVLNPRWSPKHPYTEMLLAAEAALAGGERSPATPVGGAGEGCPFSGRCSRERPRCAAEPPPQVALEKGHRLACWEVGA